MQDIPSPDDGSGDGGVKVPRGCEVQSCQSGHENTTFRADPTVRLDLRLPISSISTATVMPSHSPKCVRVRTVRNSEGWGLEALLAFAMRVVPRNVSRDARKFFESVI